MSDTIYQRQCEYRFNGNPADQCPNLIHPFSHLCPEHDPTSLEHTPDAPPPDASPCVADASTQGPTQPREPTDPCVQPGSPCVQPVKYSQIDRDARLALARCEGGDEDDICPVCNFGLHQCHAFIWGDPCRFPARREHIYCINHDPAYREQRREQSRRAGLASAASRATTPGIEHLTLYLGDRAGVQAVIDLVIRLELLGQISAVRSRNILRACAIALRNLSTRRSAGLSGPDLEAYLDLREDIETLIPDALAQARANDAPPPRNADSPTPRPAKSPIPRYPGTPTLANLAALFDLDDGSPHDVLDQEKLMARMLRR